MKIQTLLHALSLSLLAAASALPAWSQTTDTFTTDAAISAADTSHEGHNIVVHGATLTLDGTHAFNNLVVESGGVVTHSFGASSSGVNGMALTIAHDVTVDAGTAMVSPSRISVDGRGFASATGPGAGLGMSGKRGGGGGHGGAGGGGNDGEPGGGVYDSVLQPAAFGSGGGTGYYDNVAGSGGGGVRLTVGGTLTVNGALTANGTGGDSFAGGGAGGSLWLSAATIAGTGVISANGGDGSGGAGGGAGGRIALIANTVAFSGVPSAYGSNGPVYGGAGTIYAKAGSSRATITVGNNGNAGATTEFSGAQTFDANLVVLSGGIVGPPAGQDGFFLTFTGDVNVAPGGAFAADGRGYSSQTGTGAGAGMSSRRGGGGGHGGAGGNSSDGEMGGGAYGSVLQPITFGSGGGTGYYGNIAGTGGGALRLAVNGTLTLNGRISANGSIGDSYSGGGAGGSVWVSAGSLAGSGTVAANGGDGRDGGGGGGGGRVSVVAGSSSFGGGETAFGGNGYVYGGAGTVYARTGAARATLAIANNGFTGAATEFSGSQSFDANLVVGPGGVLGPPVGQPGLFLSFSGDAAVQSGGVVGADGRGFPSATGAGAGAGMAGFRGGGGGYGGGGGNGVEGRLGGGTYAQDVLTQPVALGSGGGTGYYDDIGGSGGGALHLAVGGALTVDGRISANGYSGASYTGGGSGGSVWVSAATLAGGVTGVISANGADGSAGGGGGGGGRVAVYYGSTTFGGAETAFGGNGSVYGGAGTVFVKPASGRGVITVANNANVGAVTEFSGIQTYDANLLVAAGGIVGPPVGLAGLFLTFDGDVTVASDGFIAAAGRGSASPAGVGAGAGAQGSRGGGAGYGGAGGFSSDAKTGGRTYALDTLYQPVALGSGGGIGYFNDSGGSGGGAIHLSVGGTLTVDGQLSANGATGASYTGGGSGGSLWVSTGTFAGGAAGVVSANGGNGKDGGGGGGGGRIALYYNARSFAGTVLAAGGDGGQRGGAGTVYQKPSDPAKGVVIVDNGGALGAVTEFYTATLLAADLRVRNDGILGPPAGQPLNLTVNGDATIENGGYLSANGRGYGGMAGPGAGSGANSFRGGGGGYGGVGGASSDGKPGGPIYGLDQQDNPTALGSGGGQGYGGDIGGAGGGAIQLGVEGTLRVDGALSADGISGGSYTGGGSGGSLLVSANALTGTGAISANGGMGRDGGGGGGGGRIAFYLCTAPNAGLGITATGGAGSQNGTDGTVRILGVNPMPILTSVDPATVPHGGPAFLLTVRGSAFNGLARVRVNGVDRPTTFVSTTQLTALVAASDVAAAGTAGITVVNPTNCGGVSGAVTLTITTTLFGDVDANVAVNVADVVRALRVAGGLSASYNLTNGDVAPYAAQTPKGYGDGRLNLLDAERILQFLNGQ